MGTTEPPLKLGNTDILENNQCANVKTATAGKPYVRLLSRAELIRTLKDLFNYTGNMDTLKFADDTQKEFSSPLGESLGATELISFDEFTPQISAEYIKTIPTKCADQNSAVSTCVKSFVTQHGLKILRRPLESAEQSEFEKIYSGGRSFLTHDEGLALVLESMLQSPRFLYRSEVGLLSNDEQILTQYEFATALSYLITRTTPDDLLLESAKLGKLQTKEQIVIQVDRLLSKPAAIDGISEFYKHWVNGADLDTVSKDAGFTDFNSAYKNEASEEIRDFVKKSVLGTAVFKDLFSSKQSKVGPTLAKVYGVGTEGDAVTLPATERAGLWTSALAIAAGSTSADTRPLHMGSLVLNKLLCEALDPPPANAINSPFTSDPKKSKRQNFETRTSAPTCKGCHTVLNPIAFAFDAYDPIGRKRSMIGAFAIDTSGSVTKTRDANGNFADLTQMLDLMAQSDQAAQCHAMQYMQYAVGRKLGTSDSCALRAVHESYKKSGYNLRKMITEVILSDTFRKRIKGAQL